MWARSWRRAASLTRAGPQGPVPVVQVLSSSWLMKRGILLKSGDALERLASIDTAIFDKTGTLTLGCPELIGEHDAHVMQLAASLAVHSKHPYSAAISAAYSGELLSMQDIQETAGVGVQTSFEGSTYALGKAEGAQVALSKDSQILSAFQFADRLRPDAHAVISQLQQQSIACELLSGDREKTVRSIAEQTGLRAWQAGLLPADKTAHIKAQQGAGRRVLMVGDGLNDAPSLAQANVSISPASGMDITQNTADIVFQGASLKPVIQTLRIARVSTQLVRQNFALAALYNFLAIPLAIAGYVTPLVAAIAMSLSSLIVIANSFRINRTKVS